MGNRSNPFTPTFGHVPFSLAGRTEYIDDVIGGLANRPGDPNRSTIFVGPRGSGKTVLLATIVNAASEQGWIGAQVSAREGMLEELYLQLVRSAEHLVTPESTSHITSVTLGPVSLGREVLPDEVTWRTRYTDLVEELNAQGVGVLFAVDEVNPACEELIVFVDLYQHLVTEGRDVAMMLAGLPSRVSTLLRDENVSFVRRAFQRRLDNIAQFDVEEALLDTIQENGRTITPRALELAAEAAGGFAFAIQLVGYYLWRAGKPEEEICEADALLAIEQAKREMERSVFRPTLTELSPREEEYLRAMAAGEEPSVTSDVARRMGIGMTNASNIRRRLIEYGLIGEVRMGLVEFEMPLLRDYLRETG